RAGVAGPLRRRPGRRGADSGPPPARLSARDDAKSPATPADLRGGTPSYDRGPSFPGWNSSKSAPPGGRDCSRSSGGAGFDKSLESRHPPVARKSREDGLKPPGAPRYDSPVTSALIGRPDGVGGSSSGVEHHVANVVVVGSNPISRSIFVLPVRSGSDRAGSR